MLQYAQIVKKYTQIFIVNLYYFIQQKIIIIIIIQLYFCLNPVVLSSLTKNQKMSGANENCKQ